MSGNRIIAKVTRNTLPQIKDKYPFIYLERGRLEIDDSSLKWIDADGQVIRLPIATINTLLLGPGTSVTHEAIKVASTANCSICWVGEDSLLFYASGITPTANTKNIRHQALLSSNKKQSLIIARKFFSYRFPDADLVDKTLKQMMGMEGHRVKALYSQKAEEYGVGWKGRDYIPGKFELGDITNQILTACNAALYGILCSSVHALGYSPHLGFIHSGSPLPFVYDLADLYKAHFTIDLSFVLTKELAGKYDKRLVSARFRERVIKDDLLKLIVNDIHMLMED